MQLSSVGWFWTPSVAQTSQQNLVRLYISGKYVGWNHKGHLTWLIRFQIDFLTQEYEFESLPWLLVILQFVSFHPWLGHPLQLNNHVVFDLLSK